MGLIRKRPKGEDEAPLVRGDGETSFIVRQPETGLGHAHRKVLKMLGYPKPSVGGGSERFDVTLQRIRGTGGLVRVTYEGIVLGHFDDEPGVSLARKAMDEHETRVIRARAYIWRSRHDGAYGLRIYLPV